jgi:hypothetical protein
MSVLSFKHLKPKTAATNNATGENKGGVVRNIPAGEVKVDRPEERGQSKQALSFRHLKPGAAVASPPAVSVQPSTQNRLTERTTYRIPSVADTARLTSVNYCQGCDRFWPATPPTDTNPYGRCRRDNAPGEEGMCEVWRIIPPAAPVSMCWYKLHPIAVPTGETKK